MVRIRMVEEAIADRYDEQLMRCPVHLSIGQEAVAVGVCTDLLPTDRIFSTHRCHAHYLAKGGDLKAMLAEIHGKATGCCGGRGGSMHLFDIDAGHALSLPIVGSVIPVAAGNALTDKLDGSSSVTVVFLGDGALEEGVFHETANFAAMHALPIIFLCENNEFSVYTPLSDRQPSKDLTRLARAHEVTCHHVDGSDVGAVAALTRKLVASIRAGAGPQFVQADVYRVREHCGPNYDDDLGYRSAESVALGTSRDPLAAMFAQLEKAEKLDKAGNEVMRAGIAAEIDAAFQAALDAPFPPPESATEHVYG